MCMKLSYVLWVRNTISTVELWVQDQNFAWTRRFVGSILQRNRWRWNGWWLWTGEWKWQHWGRKWSDVTKVERQIEHIEEEEFDMENVMKEKKIKWIQKFCISSTEKRFKTLDDVLNNNNYDNAPLQAERNFEYTLSKKMVKMEWKTNKNKQIHKRGAENVYKNKPGPRRAAKSVKNPSSLFKLIEKQSPRGVL